jgi:DNA-binding PadR family transcriptional regulator
VAELNPTAASLLGFLHRRPMTGWELLRAVEISIGYFWNVTQSHVYREIRSLEEQGLVTAGPPGPRERRPLKITRAGRRAFQQWISKEPAQELIRFPLLVSVFFGDHLDPETLEQFADAHRRRHEERLAEYRRIVEVLTGEDCPTDSPFPPETRRFALATVRFGMEFEEAALRWFAARPWQDGDPGGAAAG